MAKSIRFTDTVISAFVQAGFWTPHLTVDFWDRNAALHPEKEALVDSGTRLTWVEAKTRIDRLAIQLIQMGFQRDEIIMAQLYNSVELVLLRLACEKAGLLLAIVPPAFRQNELEAVLGKVRAKGACFPCDPGGFDYLGIYDHLRPRVSSLEYLFGVGQDVSPGIFSVREMALRSVEKDFDVHDLDRFKFEPFGFEEIMTTSGTTGTPKCVEWADCVRLAHARVAIERLRLSQEDVICAFSPSTGAATELLAYRCPAQVSAKTIMLEHFSPEAACAMIQKERITAAGIVPAMIARLLRFPHIDQYDLTSLRLLLNTAALLPAQLAREAEERLGCAVLSGYGSMDSGGVCLGSLDDPPLARHSTVGRPLTGSDVGLLDPEGKRVPHGQIGEVAVNGPYCVGGYYDDPEATREAWHAGLFRMGDLGRLDEAGRLQLVGRKKDVIIRGGQNIYPKEIEDLLLQHPKVSEAAIVKMPDPEMGEKACAFVVLRPGQSFAFEEMVSFLLGRKIAKFKLPERLEQIETLPLVPGGNKIDKRKLEEEIAHRMGLHLP
ncbi:MAG: AMP-binding protein [Deltaproteobacteria bacterium]|nr:AMP-binding protein [Deltaproteobacteria bacterium]